jgi:hypothetical protein
VDRAATRAGAAAWAELSASGRITVSVCADGWRSEFKYLVGPCSMERLLEEVLTGAGVLVQGGA